MRSSSAGGGGSGGRTHSVRWMLAEHGRDADAAALSLSRRRAAGAGGAGARAVSTGGGAGATCVPPRPAHVFRASPACSPPSRPVAAPDSPARTVAEDQGAEEEALAEEAQQARLRPPRTNPRLLSSSPLRSAPLAQARDAADALPTQVASLAVDVAATRERLARAKAGACARPFPLHTLSPLLSLTRPSYSFSRGHARRQRDGHSRHCGASG